MNTQYNDDSVGGNDQDSIERYAAELGADVDELVRRSPLAIKATQWMESCSEDRVGPSHVDREPISVDRFLQLVVEVGLLAESEVGSYANMNLDAKSLANHLVGLKVLTSYQANAILAGSHELVSIGNYLVLDEIGFGGMGIVYLALHRPMNRIVALKVISPHLLDSESKRNRFKREVCIAGALAHPNIVTAFDADSHGENLFLAMEYIEGENLGQMVQRKKPLPVITALKIIQQVAEGLQYAHERQVIHRDVKPSNILISSHDTAKIADLGLAMIQNAPEKQLGNSKQLNSWSPQACEGVTGSDDLLGTLNFIAPEQAEDPTSSDEKCDIYSLGCTLYYALTGLTPFTRNYPHEVVDAHSNAARPLPSHFRDDIHPSIDALVCEMMASDPEDRLKSMTSVVACLKRVRFSMNLAACNSISDVIADHRPERKKFRLPTSAIRITLAAVITFFVASSFAAVKTNGLAFFTTSEKIEKADGDEELDSHKDGPTAPVRYSSGPGFARVAVSIPSSVPEPDASASMLLAMLAFFSLVRRRTHPRRLG